MPLIADSFIPKAKTAELFDPAHPPPLALADLCLWPRLGVAGAHTRSWLAQNGHAVGGDDVLLSAGFGPQEVVLLARQPAHAQRLAQLATKWEQERPAQVHLRSCQDSHGWFALIGAQSATLLATALNVDVSRLQRDEFTAATDTAAPVWLLHQAGAEAAIVHLLFANSLAQSLWQHLMQQGAALGLQPVRLTTQF